MVPSMKKGQPALPFDEYLCLIPVSAADDLVVDKQHCRGTDEGIENIRQDAAGPQTS